MKRFAEIIDLWPKPSSVTFAADLGLPATTVRVMRHRNAVPPKYFPAIVAAARARSISGVTLEDLFSILQAPGPAQSLEQGETANA